MNIEYKSINYYIGKEFKTNENYIVKIIGKSTNKTGYYWIEFQDINKHKMEVRTNVLKIGVIKNPYHPSVRGVGYIGVGRKTKIKGKVTKEYESWERILRRCYSEKFHSKYPSYIGVTTCDKWLNFQNYALWYEENYVEGFELDKDLLQQNIENKIYSPSTCLFIPSKINGFLTNMQRSNTSGFIGVSKHSYDRVNSWQAQIRDFSTGTKKHIGCYKTKEEASKAYTKERCFQAEKAREYMSKLGYGKNIIILIK